MGARTNPPAGRRQGKARHLFAGGNTPRGFFSYFHYLPRPLAAPQPKRVWIIKGGPGVGKSTFMSRIGEEMVQRGYDVELHHCSADPDSVDGVVIPALGLAIVDGTAPHVIDPAHPGAVDAVVNLGEHWDEAEIRRRRETILDLSARYRECYAVAYRFLAAAGEIYKDWRAANASLVDTPRVHGITWELIREVTGDLIRGSTRDRAGGSGGYVRKLFASAITPAGFRHHLDSLLEPLPRRIVLRGEPGTGHRTFVAQLAQLLAGHGVGLELFHCAMEPEEPEHLLAPKLGLAVVTSAEPHVWEGEATQVIDLNELRDRGSLERNRTRVEEDKTVCWDLVGRGIQWLKRAKELHDELEQCYIPHMDFAAIEERRRRLVASILDEAER